MARDLDKLMFDVVSQARFVDDVRRDLAAALSFSIQPDPEALKRLETLATCLCLESQHLRHLLGAAKREGVTS